jgi:hypothetical protein
MAGYPAFVQLVRLLGREGALKALSLDVEPDPSELSGQQIARLQELVEAELDSIALQLVEEAAASDDVSNREGALAFVRDRVRGFGDLLTPDQARRLKELAETSTADWG